VKFLGYLIKLNIYGKKTTVKTSQMENIKRAKRKVVAQLNALDKRQAKAGAYAMLKLINQTFYEQSQHINSYGRSPLKRLRRTATEIVKKYENYNNLALPRKGKALSREFAAKLRYQMKTTMDTMGVVSPEFEVLDMLTNARSVFLEELKKYK